jgi:hypothetical protein
MLWFDRDKKYAVSNLAHDRGRVESLNLTNVGNTCFAAMARTITLLRQAPFGCESFRLIDLRTAQYLIR